jgi:hypothetical protein
METETDIEIDMKRETETDNTWTWTWNWGTPSLYSTVRITTDMPWRNFQWHCVLVGPFYDEKKDTKNYAAIGTAL